MRRSARRRRRVQPRSRRVLTPQEKVAVTIAAQTAATEQDSQAPLFANLGTAATSAALPPKLQQAVLQVLAQQTSLDPNLTGADIKTAFQKSGLFLEASLAAGAVPVATRRHRQARRRQQRPRSQGRADRAATGIANRARRRHFGRSSAACRCGCDIGAGGGGRISTCRRYCCRRRGCRSPTISGQPKRRFAQRFQQCSTTPRRPRPRSTSCRRACRKPPIPRVRSPCQGMFTARR